MKACVFNHDVIAVSASITTTKLDFGHLHDRKHPTLRTHRSAVNVSSVLPQVAWDLTAVCAHPLGRTVPVGTQGFMHVAVSPRYAKSSRAFVDHLWEMGCDAA